MPRSGWSIPDVTGITFYLNDVVVERDGGSRPRDRADPTRGLIREFSEHSRKRLAFVASNTPIRFTTMITLTYPNDFPKDGKLVKKHLHAFLQWLRRTIDDPQYLWFIEFQERGAPHYHILLNDRGILKRKQEVSQYWYDTVGSNDEKHLLAGTRTERIRKKDGAKRYAVKYAIKLRQKVCPEDYNDVGRFWGMSKKVAPAALIRMDCDDASLRALLEDWRYRPQPHHPIYHTLYNVSTFLGDKLEIALDYPEE